MESDTQAICKNDENENVSISELESKIRELEGKLQEADAENARLLNLLNSSAKSSEELLDFKNDLKKIVSCGICQRPPRGPTDINGLCHKCLDHYVCNLCSKKDCKNEKSVSVAADSGRKHLPLGPVEKRQVEAVCSQFDFDCKFSASGCNVRGKLKALESHRATCDHRHVRCLWPGCKGFLSISNFESHFIGSHRAELNPVNSYKVPGKWFYKGNYLQVFKWKTDEAVLVFPHYSCNDEMGLNSYYAVVTRIEKCHLAKAEIRFYGSCGEITFPLKICPLDKYRLISLLQKKTEGYILEISRNYIEAIVGPVQHFVYSLYNVE